MVFAIKMFFMLLTLPSIILSGFVFSKMWEYFVVPLGVQSIGVWWATGLLYTISFCCKTKELEIDDEDDISALLLKEAKELAIVTISPLVIWAIGAFIHAVM